MSLENRALFIASNFTEYNFETIRELFRFDLDINFNNGAFLTELFKNGFSDEKYLRKFIDLGANPAIGDAIYYAILNNDEECLNIFLEHGATVTDFKKCAGKIFDLLEEYLENSIDEEGSSYRQSDVNKILESFGLLFRACSVRNYYEYVLDFSNHYGERTVLDIFLNTIGASQPDIHGMTIMDYADNMDVEDIIEYIRERTKNDGETKISIFE